MTPADIALINGSISTCDDRCPHAQAVAITQNSILAVEKNRDITPFISSRTRVIDLGGKRVVPGFIEGHGHFLALGRAKMNLALSKARNWNDIVSLVKEKARNSRPGEWITGRGWHQEKWDTMPETSIQGMPVHNELSRAAPAGQPIVSYSCQRPCVHRKYEGNGPCRRNFGNA